MNNKLFVGLVNRVIVLMTAFGGAFFLILCYALIVDDDWRVPSRVLLLTYAVMALPVFASCDMRSPREFYAGTGAGLALGYAGFVAMMATASHIPWYGAALLPLPFSAYGFIACLWVTLLFVMCLAAFGAGMTFRRTFEWAAGREISRA